LSEDKGFDVVDKRKSKAKKAAEETEAQPEVEEQETAAEAAPAEEPVAQEPEAEEGKQGGPSADVYTVVTWMIGMLASSAWQTMGLQIDQSSGKIEKDLVQAKVAIDCVMALADRISAHMDESGKRELRGLISDLQLNFVNQSKEA
jgi:hypothetical protein